MKNNSKSTTSQPQYGNQSTNDPLVKMDLQEHIAQIKAEPTWINGNRSAVALYKSETMRIMLMGLHEHAKLKAHKANGVISVQVVEGKMHFVTEEETVLLEKGQLIALPENRMHSVLALQETFFLLTLALNK